MTEETRSPLKAKPLRYPGQSCDERRRRLFKDKLEEPAIMAAAAAVIAGLEIWRAYMDQPPHPWTYVFIAFSAIVFLVFRLRKYRLRGDGYEVFHDIPADDFNIDHVLVGPGGVFTIETKTWKKRANSRITFDGKTVLVNGFLVGTSNPQKVRIAMSGCLNRRHSRHSSSERRRFSTSRIFAKPAFTSRGISGRLHQPIESTIKLLKGQGGMFIARSVA